jgi:hypothetical protein
MDQFDRPDRWTLLKVLFDRAVAGQSDASLSISGLSGAVGRGLAPAVIQIYCDELVEAGLLSKPAHGVRDRYKITGAGIKYVDELTEDSGATRNNSTSWTGDYGLKLSNERASEIVAQIRELGKIIELAPLSNEEKSQAMSLFTAALAAAEAPKPAWHIVRETLVLIAGIATCLSFALQVAGLIS